jgi:prefoldin subunit 5
MGFVLNYQASVYNQQIQTIQGHLGRLQTCYDNMERLKTEIWTFWNDERAREAGIMLDKTMQRVRNEMSRATKLMNVYTSTVTYVTDADAAMEDLKDDAFGALDSLGGMIE